MNQKQSYAGGMYSIGVNGNETSTSRNGVRVQTYDRSPQQSPVPRKSRSLDLRSLPGPKLKIQRAKHHIDELIGATFEFYATEPCRIAVETDAVTGESVFRLQVRAQVPALVSAIVGDAVHNLRSALDYLICDLIRATGKTPSMNAGYYINVKPRKTEKSRNIGRAAQRIIDRLQSYKSVNEKLVELNILDVYDKHNAITTVVGALIEVKAKVGLPGTFVSSEGYSVSEEGVPPS